MPQITDRSNKKPLLDFTQRIGHGTLSCLNLAKTRRFYEEILGLDVIQPSPISLMIRKGTDHIYAVVEVPSGKQKMSGLLNHNGLDVATREEVDRAYQLLLSIKDEWGLLEVQKPGHNHGDYSFFFQDFDGNWWEITQVRPGGNSTDFKDPERDLTGHQEFVKSRGVHAHTHDPDFRAVFKAKLEADKAASQVTTPH